MLVSSEYIRQRYVTWQCTCDPHSSGSAHNSFLSINPRKWLVTLAARARSRIRTPSSMLRSKAASVRFAEVMKTASPSATTALAWSTPAGPSSSRDRRVVVDAGARFAGPVCRPESIGEPAHKLIRGGCVASSSLDVQQQRDLQLGVRVNPVRQGGECPRSVEEDVRARPDRSFSRAQQFLVHPPRVPCVQSRYFGTGPHQVRGR